MHMARYMTFKKIMALTPDLDLTLQKAKWTLESSYGQPSHTSGLPPSQGPADCRNQDRLLG